MFFAIDSKMVIEAYNARQTEEEPFKPWTGKAPPNESDLALKVGIDWAKANNIRKHSLCKEHFPAVRQGLNRMGCDKQVTQVNVVEVIKPVPKHIGWNDGTTTAECLAERRAYWDLVTNDMREQGDDYAASVWERKTVAPELRECANFDNIRIGDVIYQPQIRLTDILRKVRNGTTITKEERLTIQKDYPGVESFPENQYRSKYMAEVDELFKIAGGRNYVLGKANKAKIPDLDTLNKSARPCEDYLAKINAFKARDKEISDAEGALNRANSHASNSIEWQALNKERVANMDQWGNMVADAEAASCAIE